MVPKMLMGFVATHGCYVGQSRRFGKILTFTVSCPPIYLTINVMYQKYHWTHIYTEGLQNVLEIK